MAIKKKVDHTARNVGIGGAITAAVLASAAGAYLLSDKKNQTKAKAWVSKARKDIAKHAKMAKKFSESEYKQIVDEVVKQYGPLENLTAGDIIKAGRELKGEWNKIQAHAKTLVKTAKKATAKKPAAHKAKPSPKKKARV